MTARLALVGAAVEFGDVCALDGVDLEVAAGEVVVVLGPSGSGKSTLLRSIAGLQPLDRGQVLLDGIDVGSVPPHRRGVGLMFQDHALFPHLDVGDNVAFGLRMQRRSADAAADRVRDLLHLVGLSGTERRAIQTLSGGEQQRVALARALAPAPAALLLDEPLGALDRTLRERLVSELRSLFDQLPITVVAVTHDHSEAFALADRLVLMDRGRVVQSGSPAAVWHAPASAHAAALLGFTNIASASVADGRLRTPWGDAGEAVGDIVAVVVRPAGVRIGPAGSVEGTVVSSRFAGARAALTIAVDGAPALDAEVPGDEALAVGTAVRFSIDPTAVTTLPG